MKNADIIEFAVCNQGTGTIVALKHYEHDCFFITAFIKELPGCIIQSDSWNEEVLLKKTDHMYDSFRKYAAKGLGISLPAALQFTIQYVDEEGFFKNDPDLPEGPQI